MENSDLHIVLANQWYPPESGWGGVAMYNHTIARAFRRIGHQVTVVAARYDKATPPVQERDGVRIVRLLVRDNYRLRRLPGLGHYVRPVKQLLYSWRVNQVLRKLHSATPIDLVEFTDVNAEGFCYLRDPQAHVIVRCQTPTFVLREYYTSSEMPYDTVLTTYMEKTCLYQAHMLTAPSYDMARTIALHTRVPVESIAVVPNALDYSPFSCNDLSFADNDRITVLHVGRLDRTKGIEVLAQAIPLVVRKCPEVQFVYVGDDRPTGDGDTWRQRLAYYFDQTGVSEYVVFTGPVDQTTLIEWYRRADICVTPSVLYESFSYTVAQAMAAGVPVIASRIGGIPETVDDQKSGVLVESGNISALARAIVQLVRDPKRRQTMGSAGQNKARTVFAPEVVAERMLDLYRQIQSSPIEI